MYDQQQAQYVVWNAQGPALPDVARAFSQQARAPFLAAAGLLTAQDADAKFKAQAVLSMSKDLAIGPVIDADLRAAPPDVRVFAVRTVLRAELDLRAAVVAYLETLLADKDEVPTHETPGPRPDESFPRVRVCDEAFLALRETIYFGEDTTVQTDDERLFLDLSFAQRDLLIERAKGSRAYRRARGEYIPDDEDTP